LGAALGVFIEHGVEGATIEQIATNARVARTTLYRRWSSKEALIAQAIEVARGAPEQRAVVKRVALSRLPSVLVDALAQILTGPDYKRLAARLIGSVPNCPALMNIYWKNHMLPRREAIRTLLDRARTEGLIRQDSDSEVLLDLISGAIMHHLLVRPGERSSRYMRAYLLKLLHELGLCDAATHAPAALGGIQSRTE
jgi:AcrR family transcriptional regulator